MILTKDPVEFVMHYATYTDKESLRERIQKHIEYKTCKILFDTRSFICAICLWNISVDCLEVEIIDLVIREDFRNKDLMRQILMEGLKIWPVKFMKWNRDYTKDGSSRWHNPKIFSVECFLRRKNVNDKKTVGK